MGEAGRQLAALGLERDGLVEQLAVSQAALCAEGLALAALKEGSALQLAVAQGAVSALELRLASQVQEAESAAGGWGDASI